MVSIRNGFPLVVVLIVAMLACSCGQRQQADGARPEANTVAGVKPDSVVLGAKKTCCKGMPSRAKSLAAKK